MLRNITWIIGLSRSRAQIEGKPWVRERPWSVGYAKDNVNFSHHFVVAEQLLGERRIEEALAEFDFAEREGHDPDVCSAGRWTCMMLTGRFEAAWRESDLIAKRGKPDPHSFWDGQPCYGRRVLIRCLHGLGDTIQFVRYASLLRGIAASVSIEAQPLLKELLGLSGLADHVFTWNEPEPAWDQQIEIIELPRVFRTTLGSIPARVPYLFAPGGPGCAADSGFRVGLVWCSSAYDPARNIPLELAGQLCSLAEVQFHSLQADPGRAGLQRCVLPIQDVYDPSGSVMAAARSLQKMDLLITVDTMMAHLAGALARPVWTLLPYQADWRWMLDRDDSPWYPTMRLFRQTSSGDWQGVIDRVRNELERHCQTVAGLADVSTVERGSAAPGSVK
ncbi:MAG: hypothetical protein JO319_18770 [Acidobacteriaceae bacterium]|nr:hypothetical protein [Acidobacteriaceae bacterium]